MKHKIIKTFTALCIAAFACGLTACSLFSSSEESTDCTITLNYNTSANSYATQTITVESGTAFPDLSSYDKDTGSSEIIGWSTSATELIEYSGAVSEDITLYAIWDDYKVVEFVYSSDNVKEYKYYRSSASSSSVPNEIEIVGYMLDGWYTNSDYSGEALSSINFDSLADKYYAKYSVAVYSITFDGGVYTGEIETVYYNYGDTDNLPILTCTGYIFEGWCTDANCNTDPITTISADMYGNKTLYAKWSANTYIITLDADGGSLSNSVASVKYDQSFTLDVPTKEGYSFLYWVYDDGESQTQITNSSGLSLSKYSYAGNVTFKAIYVISTYTVTYETSGGTSISSQTYIHGDTLLLPNDPEREGYLFLGWYDSSESVEYTSSYIITSDLTIYATWRLSTGISTYTQLVAIAESTSTNYHLLNDIDCEGKTWTPISSFTGVFDGQEHIISNFIISSSEANTGFFSSNSGTICNLIISGAYVSATRAADVIVGALVGVNSGVVENCGVESSKINGNAEETSDQGSDHARYAVVGGMVGKNSGTINDCYVTTSTVYGYSKRYDGGYVGGSSDIAVAYVGGLVGEVSNKGTVNNCEVYNMTSIKGYGYFRCYAWGTQYPYIKVVVGGVIGILQSGSSYSGCTSDMDESSSVISASYGRVNDSPFGSETTNCSTHTGGVWGKDER